MVGENKSMVIFLIETKSKEDKVKAIKRCIGYERCFVVKLVGNGGGLALLWLYEHEVEI